MATRTKIGTVAILGVGMIGGSLGLALKANGAGTVLGVDTGPLDDAVKAGAIDRGVSLEVAAAEADLIVLCTPVGAFAELATAIAPHLKPTAVISDAGSVKGPVADALTPILGPRYVGAHPIAGKEHSGVGAADPNLFHGALCIVTPDKNSDPDAVAAVTALWEQVGARVETMTGDVHDQVFACVSHLPHLVAYALMETVASTRPAGIDPAEYAAGGLRDFTRIAGSDPTMWRDIFLTNRTAMLTLIGTYQKHLEMFRKAIESGDAETLMNAFETARTIRDQVSR